jgi:hypothetical protein
MQRSVEYCTSKMLKSEAKHLLAELVSWHVSAVRCINYFSLYRSVYPLCAYDPKLAVGMYSLHLITVLSPNIYNLSRVFIHRCRQ